MNRSRRRFPIFPVLLLVSSLACFITGAVYTAQSQTLANSVNHFILLSEASGKEIINLYKENSSPQNLASIIWTQDNRATMKNPTLDTEVKISQIIYIGDIRLLFPELSKHPGGKNELVLSSKASELLFGSSDSTGSTVRLDGRDYEVICCMKSSDSFSIRNIDELGDSERIFDRVSTKSKDFEGYTITSDIVQSTFALDNNILSYRQLVLGILIVLFLFPVVAVSFLFGFARKAFKRHDHFWKKALVWLAVIVSIIIGTLVFSQYIFSYGDLFPSKWSSSVLWKESFQNATESLLFLVSSPMSIVDISILRSLATALGLSALSLILVLFTFRQFDIWSISYKALHKKD